MTEISESLNLKLLFDTLYVHLVDRNALHPSRYAFPNVINAFDVEIGRARLEAYARLAWNVSLD